MTDGDYLCIILDGLTEHQLYLAEHFQRSAEKAKLGGVDANEFYNRLEAANNTLVDALKRELYRNSDVWQVGENGERIQFVIEQMSVNLFQFAPNTKYSSRGLFSWQNTEYIRLTINLLRQLDKTAELLVGISNRNKAEEAKIAKQIDLKLKEQQSQINSLELALKTPTFWIAILSVLLSIISLYFAAIKK